MDTIVQNRVKSQEEKQIQKVEKHLQDIDPKTYGEDKPFKHFR